MDTEKNRLFEMLQREEITPQEYFSLSDEVDRRRREQAVLFEREQTAKKIEGEILKSGGVAVKRSWGEIPNPWAGNTRNLTNQMALLRRNPDLATNLQREVGLAVPDYRYEESMKERERIERENNIRNLTAKLRELNNQKLGIQPPHEDYAAAVENYQRQQQNNIPFFGR